MRGKTSACPAGLCFLFPSRQRQALIKFFGVEGEREGEAAPFVHKRGAFPSHKSSTPLLRAIQHAQGYGLGHMGGSDGVLALQVGDGTGQTQHPRVGAGGEA